MEKHTAKMLRAPLDSQPARAHHAPHKAPTEHWLLGTRSFQTALPASASKSLDSSNVSATVVDAVLAKVATRPQPVNMVHNQVRTSLHTLSIAAVLLRSPVRCWI